MKKKTLGIISVVLFTLILAVPALARVITNEGITLKYLKDRNTGKVLFGQLLHTDNGRYAYCLHNNKHSPSGDDLPEGAILTDEVYTALTVGYPNRSYTGSQQKDYYATQAVIRCLKGEFDINNLTANAGWSQAGVMDAVHSIYNQATQNIQHQQPYLNISQSNVGTSLSGDFYLTPLLTTNSNNVKDSSLSLNLNGAPGGTRLVNEGGGFIDRVNVGQNFKIAIPKSNYQGDFTFTLTGEYTKSVAQVYNATRPDMQDVVSLQDKRESITSSPTRVSWNDTGTIQIIKRDGENNNLVGYARFRVQGPNGFNQVYNMPESGYIDIRGLVPGRYTLTEEEAPGGYIKDSKTVETLDLNAGQTLYPTFKNYKAQGSIDLYKTDSETGKPLAGATYRFYQKSNRDMHWDYTTDNTGHIQVPNWWFDTYIYKEIKAPDGYILNDTEHEITISERKVYQINETNKPAYGTIKVTKLGEGNKKLANAHFAIKDAKGSVVANVVTNSSGEATSPRLPYGTYTVTETQAPTGYVITNKDTNVTINQNKEYPISVTNGVVHAQLKLIKLDTETNKPLAGATIVVKKGDQIIAKKTTDSTGMINISDVEFGKYTVQETDAPEGYVLTDTPVEFSVTKDGEIIKVPIPNTKKKGNITIIKKDDENNPVEGAEFVIKDSDGKVLHTVKTDKAGVASGGDLPWGTYTVEETKAPNGYLKDSKPQTARIWFGIPQTLNFTDTRIKAKLEVIKQDSKTSEKLEGAQFRIQGPNGFNKVATTDKQGKVNLTGLYVGDYTVTEIKAPDGYNLNSTVRNFTVSENNKLYSLTVTNIKHSENLSIIKKDQEGKPVPNVTFEIRHKSDNSLVQTVTTNSSGIANINDIAFGSYVVKETKVPDGYLMDAKPQDLVVGMNKVNDMNFVNTKIYGNIKIVKTDEETKVKLPNTKFQISGPNGYFKETTTDSNGEINLNKLPYGEYTITEITAPNDYILDNTPIKVKITENGKTYTVAKTNRLMDSNLLITKVDDKGNKLSNVKFQLVNKSNNAVVKEGVTDNNGSLEFKELRRGNYVLKEVEIPKGYINPNPNVDINITKHETINKTIVNTKIRGSIKIMKIDEETHDPLAGAKFRISQNGKLIKDVTTDTNGLAQVDALEFGEYEVQEIEAPKDYNINNTKTKINITENGKVYSVNASNRLKDCSITINKKNEVGNNLAGVKFQLLDKTTNKVLQEKETDINGVLRFDGVRRGFYVVKELDAPKGHVKTTDTTDVVIDRRADVSKTVINNRIKGNVKITKLDEETKQPLAGAKFEISQGGKQLTTVITNDKGEATVSDLIYGEYDVKEIEAPKDYMLNSTPQKLNIAENGKTYTLTFNDRLKDCSITVNKVNEIGTKLANVKFNLVNKADNKVVKQGVTNNEGKLVFTDLRRGNYTVTETEIPVGHVNANTTKDVSITKYENPEVTIVNTRTRGNIKVTKLDEETNKPLAGAQFELWRDGSLITTITSDDKGIAIANNILYGKYTVKEVTPPENYELNKTPQEVNLTDNGKTYELTFKNRMKDCSIFINKVNEVGNKLKDAKFKLSTKDGKELQTLTTDGNGHLEFKGLRRGDYIVTELVAPEGHVIDQVNYPVSITKFESPTLTVINTRIRGNLNIIKIDAETKKTLSNAKFKIVQGSTTVKEVTTDSNGKATAPNLLYGMYAVQEVIPPQDYELNNELKSVNISENGKDYTLTFENRMKDCSITVNKENEIGTKLNNVKFGLFDSKGNKIQEKLTDNNGKIVFDGLRRGDYTVKELEIPRGHVNENISQEVHITKYEHPSIKFVNTRIRGVIAITKLDEETKEKLPNAKFEISQNGKVIETVTTDRSGIAKTSNLLYGEYTIKEIEAPKDYYLNSTPQTVNITENGKVYPITFTDRLKDCSITVNKENEIGNKLENVKFDLIDRSNNKVLQSSKTDKDGKIVFSNLRRGTYLVKETEIPVGHVNESIMKEIVIDEFENPEITLINTRIRGDIKVIKLDSEDNRPLPGADFGLYQGGKLLDRKITDSKGEVWFENMLYDNYEIRELKAPEGHLLNTQTFKIAVTGNHATHTITVKDDRIKGDVEIFKRDEETGKPIANTEFSIFKGSNKIQTLLTDNSGHCKSKQLDYGDYTVVETKPAEGFNPNSQVYPLHINKHSVTVQFNIDNKPIKGDIKIVKKDAITKAPMQDIKFVIYKEGDMKTPVRTLTTDVSGECVAKNLRYGKYIVKEVTVRPDYHENKNEYKVEVKEQGSINTVNVENLPVLARVRLNKIDNLESIPLANAKFKVIRNDKDVPLASKDKDNYNEALHELTTDENGEIVIPNELRYGDYTLVEVDPPEGYNAIEPITFNVAKDKGEVPNSNTDGGNGTDVRVINLKATDNAIKGKVTLTKYDKEDKDTKLPGVKFELKRLAGLEGEGVVGEYTTNDKGEITVENLTYGDYVFKETKTLDNYVLDETEIPFSVVDENANLNLSKDNLKVKGTLNITKLDEQTKEPIKDVKFDILKDDKVIESCVTDQYGKASVANLLYGKYEIKESKPAEGYLPNEETVPFMLSKSGEVIEKTIFNKKIKGTVVLKKVDKETNQPIKGAKFDIMNTNLKDVVVSGTTDENGLVKFKLDYGKYYFKETVAPKGYMLDKDPHFFNVKDNETTLNYTVPNEPDRKSVV